MTLKGALAIGFGIILLIMQYPLIKSSLAISFGFILVASGGMIFTGAFLHRCDNPRWRLWLIEGAFDILLGAFFIFKPQMARAFFLIFLALWAIVIGIIQMLTSFRMISYMERWWTMLLTGIFCILFAILLLINPFYASYSLSSIIGVACLIFGLLMVYSSRILRDIYL